MSQNNDRRVGSTEKILKKMGFTTNDSLTNADY